ncbi:MAG: LysR family transcriptional regulator [Myxococcales bacterium]|nr:LysR family transcriptional regulator [Myxococcales bacterium]
MHDVHGIDLHRIDLNLLVALDALIRQRSVTKAAQRTGVSQSAMSHTLRRLRDLVGDPLLVRAKGGMQLTPRAEALATPLRSGLLALERALAEPEAFDASRSTRTFRLCSPDAYDLLTMPALLARLRRDAPAVSVAVLPTPSALEGALESGDLDVAVVPVQLSARALPKSAADDRSAATEPAEPVGESPPADLVQRTLLRDSLCCYLRVAHPALGHSGRLSLTRYCSLAHVLVSPRGEGPGVVDVALAERDRQRRVAVRVPSFATALDIAASSDLVLTAPRSLQRLASARGLVCCAAPLALPRHAVTMLWHARFSEDPAHRWFRQQLLDTSNRR